MHAKVAPVTCSRIYRRNSSQNCPSSAKRPSRHLPALTRSLLSRVTSSDLHMRRHNDVSGCVSCGQSQTGDTMNTNVELCIGLSTACDELLHILHSSHTQWYLCVVSVTPQTFAYHHKSHHYRPAVSPMTLIGLECWRFRSCVVIVVVIAARLLQSAANDCSLSTVINCFSAHNLHTVYSACIHTVCKIRAVRRARASLK